MGGGAFSVGQYGSVFESAGIAPDGSIGMRRVPSDRMQPVASKTARQSRAHEINATLDVLEAASERTIARLADPIRGVIRETNPR